MGESIFNRGTEQVVPQARRDAEITLLCPVVMIRMTQLGSVKERSAIQAIAMNRGMNNSIPKVSKHQTGRKATCHVEAGLPPKWNEYSEPKGAEAQPKWSTDQRTRTQMVHIMHSSEQWNSMKDKAMNDVFSKGPSGDPHNACDQPMQLRHGPRRPKFGRRRR